MNNDKYFSDLRREYETDKPLEQTTVQKNPFQQFERWFKEAIEYPIDMPNAMTLATVDKRTMQPSARIVLMKTHDQSGIVFYSSSNSRKGKEIFLNNKAALLFFWAACNRQVRIEGEISKTNDEETECYFQTRPRESQLAAWASEQSSIIKDRSTLETKMRQYKDAFCNQKVPRPQSWVGYHMAPNRFEFWQGRPNRLHDRITYQKEHDEGWCIERLSP